MEIKHLGKEDIFLIGEIEKDYVSEIFELSDDNLEVVLTGERRNHYLDRHPRMIWFEKRLQDLILSPDEVYRNKRQRNVAIFYKKLDEAHYQYIRSS